SESFLSVCKLFICLQELCPPTEKSFIHSTAVHPSNAVIPNRFSSEEPAFRSLTSLLYACKNVCARTENPTLRLSSISLSFRVGFSPRRICIYGGKLLKLYGTDWMLVTGGRLRGLPIRNYDRLCSRISVPYPVRSHSEPL